MPKIIKGSPDMTINGLPAARKGDAIDNKKGTGAITSASSDFKVNNKGAARLSDSASKSIGMITQGSPDFFVNGLPIARLGDKT